MIFSLAFYYICNINGRLYIYYIYIYNILYINNIYIYIYIYYTKIERGWGDRIERERERLRQIDR